MNPENPPRSKPGNELLSKLKLLATATALFFTAEAHGQNFNLEKVNKKENIENIIGSERVAEIFAGVPDTMISSNRRINKFEIDGPRNKKYKVSINFEEKTIRVSDSQFNVLLDEKGNLLSGTVVETDDSTESTVYPKNRHSFEGISQSIKKDDITSGVEIGSDKIKSAYIPAFSDFVDDVITAFNAYLEKQQ